MKPSVTWVLLADGTRAKVFQHKGPGSGLRPIEDLKFEEEALKASEIMADRPGRASSSVGGGRSAMEYSSDPVAVREANFVRRVAEELERRHEESAFSRLIIAAAPTALGTIRTALSDRVRQAVVTEMPKNLLHMSTPELERHFGDILVM